MSDIFEVAAKAAYKASIENATDPALNWENIPETSREYWRKIAVASSSVKFDPHDLPEEIEIRVTLHRRKVQISTTSKSGAARESTSDHFARIEYAVGKEANDKVVRIDLSSVSLETIPSRESWLNMVKLSLEDKMVEMMKRP